MRKFVFALAVGVFGAFGASAATVSDYEIGLKVFGGKVPEASRLTIDLNGGSPGVTVLTSSATDPFTYNTGPGLLLVDFSESAQEFTVHYDLGTTSQIQAFTYWTFSVRDFLPSNPGTALTGVSLVGIADTLIDTISTNGSDIFLTIGNLQSAAVGRDGTGTRGQTESWTFAYTTNHAVVPLPAGFALMLGGLGAMGIATYRRRRAA
jgi:hypothetical protein